MAIYGKADTSADIINGLATVLGGSGKPQYHDDTQRTQHLPSGDSVLHFQVLDGRYEVAPSGWNA